MQAAQQTQQALVPQSSPQVQNQGMSQATGMAQVMSQGPQTAQSPHGVTASMPQQSPQYYVQASIASAMQGPPAIAPAPGPQTTTTTVSALHQPLQHNLTHQSLTHPGVSQSPMPQFPQQVQVIQSGIPGGPYLQQVYQNAQGQFIMPIQPHGMNAQLQQGTLNPLNSSIQVITAGKPFQGQLGPHMLTSTGGKPGVLQSGQASYQHGNNQNSGGQTVLISQLGGQLGVISSQPPNILPAHSQGQKPGDMHKVNNMTFQQGIAWATPGALHSPTLLQNQPIFIRGPQPGQENLYIQSAQPQAMIPPNYGSKIQGENVHIHQGWHNDIAMVSSIAAMPTGNQQQKSRTGMDMQTNIQPKVMRPHNILPSMTTSQIRPGSSVSTQTASGQSTAQSQMGSHRTQGKVRGKNAAHRTSPAIGSQHQINQISVSQVLQNSHATTISISGVPNSNHMAAILPNTTQTQPALIAASAPKQISQQNPSENMNMTHQKPGTPVHPPTAPIQPTSANRILKGSPSSSPSVSSSQVSVQNSLMTTSSPVPVSMSTQTSMSPVPSVATSRTNDVSIVTSSNTTHMIPTSSYALASSCVTASYSCSDTIFTQSGKQMTSVAPQPSAATLSSQQSDIQNDNSSPQMETNGLPINSNHVNDNGTNCNASLTNGKQPSLEKTNQNASGPPKAMVKPQVMTHVIEGYVIHEASEPFPVNRSSLSTDLNKVRTSNASNTATVLPQGSLGNEMEEDIECYKCVVCGSKTDARLSKLRKKRVCSNACAKRANSAGLLKREQFKGTEESPQKRFKDGNRVDDEIGNFVTEDYSNNANNNMNVGTNSYNSNVEQDCQKSQKVEKWTVSDVVEFIRNIPSCQDYAEDFAIQEIDGTALLLLKADHLMNAMSMKLGPAVKIIDKIKVLKGERNEN